MTFGEETVALVVEMLGEFGTTAQLVSSAPTPATYNKQTGRTTSAATPASASVTVIMGDAIVEVIDGRKTTTSDATLTVEANAGDKLVVGSQTWLVGKVTRYPLQNSIVAYVAEVTM